MLISITDIIVESVKLYKENFKKFFTYMMLTFAPAGMIAISKFILTYFGPNSSLGVMGISYLLFLVLALIFTAIGFWFNIAFLRVMAHAYKGETNGSVGQELSQAKKVFWPAVGVSILTALAVLGGMILLFIPGIIFMLWFAFSYTTVALDETSIIEGMQKSKALVDGRWWSVLFRLLIPGLVLGILTAIVAGILVSPFAYLLEHTSQTSGLYPVWDVLTSLISSFVGAVISPLATMAMVILYIELKKTPLTKPTMAPQTSDTPPSPPTENSK